MAYKEFVLDEHTTVTVYKRKKSRSLRLSVAHNGLIRVSIPTWSPYSAGVQFARSKLSWIHSQRIQPQILVPNQAIGKAHRLRFEVTDKPKTSSRVYANDIIIRHPVSLSYKDAAVQKTAETASLRALKVQADSLLPQRLAALAQQHDFVFGDVKTKRLKSRWGSCDQHGNITLNVYLMQLPWQYIDYVLLHELNHTKIMQHGPIFWEALSKVVPDLANVRKTMRSLQPVLHSPLAPAVA
jgi:predicted metal-dependent hydrolase